MLELVPVVTGVAAAAAVWLSGSCDLAIGGGQRLNHCPLLSNANSDTARRSRHCSTGKTKLKTGLTELFTKILLTQGQK